MSNINTKKSFIVFFVIFLITNFIFLGIWFKFGVQSSIKEGYASLEKEIKEDIFSNIEKSIRGDQVDVMDLFGKISNKYNLLLIVKDDNNNIIFNNTEEISDVEYLMPFMININGKNYLLSVGKTNEFNIVSISKKFMIFEIIFTLVITMLALIISNEILLKPIDDTITDIKNYKFGIKPKKRKVSTEIGYIQNEFVDLTNNLEKEHEEQNRIISAISHDIKTPLTAILGYSEILNKKKLSIAERKSLEEKIFLKAQDMKAITSDFDDYLLSNKDRTYTFTKINIKDYLDRLKLEYRDDLKDKKIKFEIIDKVRIQSFNIDIGKMNRVFANLVSNSIRHLDKNGKITITCKNDNEYVYFEFKDNGTGVSDENISKIFDPLFTTNKSRKISGLGLSISKEIIEMHGGKISAVSNTNEKDNTKKDGLTINFSIKQNIN
ncbi:MAG: HAMP domain-containing histidine kinase [Bacilli bacterium]|nr:HAMP domain-containing histidine kinase [Bacilli bacterium]